MFTTQEPSEFTFEAIGQAALYVIERKDWDALLEQHPHFLEHMPELRHEYARLTRGLDWLAPGEVIDLVTRRHWWALFLMIRLPLLLATIATAAFLISMWAGVVTTQPLILLGYGVALFVALLWGIWEALDWFNDTYIVTNKRVVRLNRVLFVSDSRDEIPIEKIQSETVERGGPISVLLNISNLRITSAANDTAGVLFEEVGDVARIQQVIRREQLRVAERHRASERERLRSQIAGELRHYVFQHEQEAEPEPPATAPLSIPPPRTMRFWRRSAARRGVPLGSRLRVMLDKLLGTEMRDGNVVTWRKHYIVLLDQIKVSLLLFLILLVFAAFVAVNGVPFQLSATGIYTVIGVLMLISFAWLAWQWEDWRVDLYCLTDKEIIDTESLPFGLRYNEKRAELRNIQDVTTTRPRFLNTLLDFGNVDARVAGGAAPFTFNSVAHPRVVADEIQERIEMRKFRAAERATREQTQNVVDTIVAYHRLMTEDRFQPNSNFASLSPQLPAPVPQPATPPPPPMPILPPADEEHEFPPESEIDNV